MGTTSNQRTEMTLEERRIAAYRQARVFEPSMDGYSGAMAVYHAAFPEAEGFSDVEALHVANLKHQLLAPPEPKNGWRLDDTGALDDVVVEDVATFRLERMAHDHVWGRVYRRDGSSTTFNLHGNRGARVSLTFEHESAPPRADALAPPEPQGATNEATKAESAKDETDRRRMASLVRDVPEVGAVGGMVAGGRMERSIYDFVRACERHLADEQAKPNPDNTLIAVLCDAVRLTRELAPPRARRLNAKRRSDA